MNFDGFFLGHFFRARRCVLHSFALVRIELLLNSRLPELTRVGRELSTARFTNSQWRDVADSFQYPQTALCHDPSFPHRRKPRHHPGSWSAGRPRPSSPNNWTFSVFRRHCANSAPVPVFLYAAETLIDFSQALLRVERMRRRPKASCHHLRKVDFRQVAQRNRTETARLESPSIICGYAAQGVHHNPHGDSRA